MGWGVVVFNSNPSTATVIVTGRGNVDAYASYSISGHLTLNNSLNGGQPFVDVFMRPFKEVHKVPPNGYAWVFRNDTVATASSIFSGVVDFETDMPLRVENICYRSFAKVNPAQLRYEGYITRVDPGNDHEARVYKGLAPVADVSTLLLEFSFNDQDRAGTPLAIRYPTYDLTTLSYGDPQSHEGWLSNIGPHAGPKAVGTDMVPFYMPGWGVVDPLRCCDGAGDYPNAGNYALVYHIHASLSNLGSSSTRHVALNLTVPLNCYVEMAYACGPVESGRIWKPLNLNSGQVFEYCGLDIRPGQVKRLDAAYVLGGPACGSIYHTFSLA